LEGIVIGLHVRAADAEEIVHPRLQSGASGRPLNFTVRSHRESRLAMSTLVFGVCVTLGAIGIAVASPDSSAASTSNPLGADTKSSCERAADAWFKKNYPLPDEQTPVASGKVTYTSHSSSTKSKCFVEAIETVHVRKDGATESVDSEIHHLIDLTTGEQVGQLVIFSNHSGPLWCEVGNVKCWSVKEWNALVDPYMRH
jgi:hypothetical protein